MPDTAQNNYFSLSDNYTVGQCTLVNLIIDFCQDTEVNGIRGSSSDKH